MPKKPRITQKEIGIVKKAQAGDMSAFNKLFRMYKGFVEKVLYQYLKDWDEAKDLTNIVFLKVYNKLSTFKAYDSFGGWLRVITNHTAIDYLRRHRYKPLGELEEKISEEETDDSNETDLVNRFTYEKIMSMFKTLPNKTRRVFELYYGENLTIGEISKALNVPTGTIKSMLSRTRRKFQNNLTI